MHSHHVPAIPFEHDPLHHLNWWTNYSGCQAQFLNLPIQIKVMIAVLFDIYNNT